jgi:hypothetical protein
MSRPVSSQIPMWKLLQHPLAGAEIVATATVAAKATL